MQKKDDQHLLLNRIEDLHQQALRRHMITATEFLDMAEGSTVMAYLTQGHYSFKMWGGYEEAERKIALLYPDHIGDTPDLSEHLTFLKVILRDHRFVNTPGHRDYLGALMNLGIERRLLGDFIMQEQGCVIICVPHIADYLESQFTQVGPCQVSVDRIDTLSEVISERQFRRIKNTVSSTRLDSLVKVCINISRGNSTGLIKSGKVFVNGLEITKVSYDVSEGSIISIRGYGKFRLTALGHLTKKNRRIIEIDQYI